MKSISTVILLCAVIIIRAQDENTCKAACSCRNNLTPAGVMMSHIHNKKEWMVSYRYMTMQMSGLLNGTNIIDKEEVFTKYIMAPNNMTMDMHMLMVMYGIADRLTVMSMASYGVNKMEMSMFSPGGHHHDGMDISAGHKMQTAGFNDVKVYAAFALIKKETSQLSLFSGVNIPAGNIYAKGQEDDPLYPNRRLPYSMQLGSGSVDFMPALNYLYQKNCLAYSFQLGGIIRPFNNSIGYSLGNEISLNGWLAYKWNGYISSSLRMEAASSQQIKGRDFSVFYYNEPSANPVNYGSRKLQLFAGTVFQMKKGCLKNHRFGVEYGIPVYQWVNGIQMKLKQTLNASWAINF